MPRGTNSRRLGVLDSPTSPIRMDHKGTKGNESDLEQSLLIHKFYKGTKKNKSDLERSLSIHEFYRDTYYVFKYEDSLT